MCYAGGCNGYCLDESRAAVGLHACIYVRIYTTFILSFRFGGCKACRALTLVGVEPQPGALGCPNDGVGHGVRCTAHKIYAIWHTHVRAYLNVDYTTCAKVPTAGQCGCRLPGFCTWPDAVQVPNRSERTRSARVLRSQGKHWMVAPGHERGVGWWRRFDACHALPCSTPTPSVSLRRPRAVSVIHVPSGHSAP